MDSPGRNISGTSDRWPFEKQLEFFRQILPHAKTIGMLYTAGDDVAFAALNGIREYAESLDFVLRPQPVSNAADIYPSAVALFRNVDVMYAGMDNLIADNLESILKAALQAGKPVLSGDAQSVERGALASWAIGMYELGLETGDMVARVLKGESPGQMPVRLVSRGEPVVNRQAAERFNIDTKLLEKLNVRIVDTR
jgi:putative ABC transport system substrate-binding protein